MKLYKSGITIELDQLADIKHHLALGYVEIEAPAPVLVPPVDVIEVSPVAEPVAVEPEIAEPEPVEEKPKKAVKK